MNKKEFLNELENALSGRLTEADILEVTSDYGDIFDNGLESGKSEEEVAAEIGSPAKIARTILEDGTDGGGYAGVRGSDHTRASRGREYTDFQKNINEKTSKIFDKVVEPDQSVEIERLAPMSRRLGAYIIDCLLLGAVSVGLFFILLVPLSFMSYTTGVGIAHVSVRHAAEIGGMMAGNGPLSAPRFAFANMMILVLLFGILNLFTTVFLWATNGYTPGKWLLKMRVVKINGGKLSFLDALVRELLIKGIANSILSGILNIISFIWGCVTDDHKTVHDLAVHTRVAEWDKTKGSQWIRS